MKPGTVRFKAYEVSVKESLDRIGAQEILSKQTGVLVKPNLTNASPHPVTTPAECCEAIIRYIRACSDADIVVAEGCGDPSLETDEIFDRLGYRDMANRCGARLIDLNNLPASKYKNRECALFPEMYLPDIMFSRFVISVPVLKAHSLASITGTLKNMMGFVPPEHYSGSGGIWKKAAFHHNMHGSIINLNRYRTPDLSVMDASIGLADYHLGGRRCDPPIGKIVSGFDPLEVDREAAELLGLNWKEIPHLAGA